MKDKVRFNRAIKALVTAFFDGTLAKGNCSTCAVGNMVAAGYGKKVGEVHPMMAVDCGNGIRNSDWSRYFMTTDGNQVMYPPERSLRFEINAKDNIEKTGYSISQMAKVEFAFETNTKIHFSQYIILSKDEVMQDQYNGLMAVVEVLCEIEGIENVQEYKEMFSYQK